MSAGPRPPDPTPVPRRHRALRRDVPGAGLLPPVLTTTRKGYSAMNASSTLRPAARIAAMPSPLGLAATPLVFAGPLPTIGRSVARHRQRHQQTPQNYGYDIVLLIALLVVASMFVGVCYHACTATPEIHTGRATWGQFGLTVAGRDPVGCRYLVADQGQWRRQDRQRWLVPWRARRATGPTFCRIASTAIRWSCGPHGRRAVGLRRPVRRGWFLWPACRWPG